MARRLTLTVCILAALFVSAVRLPAASCPASSPPIGQACKQGSCPNQACCADAERNKSVSSPTLAKENGANAQVVALLAPTLHAAFGGYQGIDRRELVSRESVAFAPPRLAVLCTFLI